MKTTKKINSGWKEIKIKDISLKIHYGYTKSSTTRDTGIKFLRITDIQEYKVNWNDVPFCEIDKYDVEKYLLQERDILFARTGATVGKSFLIEGKIPKAVFASYLIRIQLSENINPKFLYYFFQSANYWKQIGIKSLGIGQPSVNASSLSHITFLLAPIEEQHSIVTRIEELFSELDEAEDDLRKILQQIEVAKYLCLKNAFEGKLTDDWRNKNVSHRTKIKSFHSKENNISKLPKEWQWVKLGNISEIIMGQSPKGSTYNDKGIGTPLINGPVEFGPTPFSYTLQTKWTTQPTKLCKKDDLILCVRGSTTGRQNIAGFTACLGRGVAAIRSINIEKKYLYHYFNFSRRRIFEMGTGTTFPSISQGQLQNFFIPICSDEEQIEVIYEIEYRYTLIENLEQIVKNNLQRIEALRFVILKMAFEGKLVFQDIAEESVVELLKGIKKEKIKYQQEQTMAAKAKPKKKKESPKELSILEIIKDQPVSAKDVWLRSEYKNNIEEFYLELKKLQDLIVETKNERESLLSLKK